MMKALLKQRIPRSFGSPLARLDFGTSRRDSITQPSVSPYDFVASTRTSRAARSNPAYIGQRSTFALPEQIPGARPPLFPRATSGAIASWSAERGEEFSFKSRRRRHPLPRHRAPQSALTQVGTSGLGRPCIPFPFAFIRVHSRLKSLSGDRDGHESGNPQASRPPL